MKYKSVFLLGRAGCGKSALYRQLQKRLLECGRAKTVERVDDFPRIWAKFLSDDAREKDGQERLHSRPTPDGDYLLTDDGVWNEVLEEVNAYLLEIDRPGHLVFIEFARSDYTEAIQNFDQSVLDNGIVVFVEVSFDTCWRRNLARHEAAIASGGDDHLVSREEMESSFLHDDQDAFVRHLKDRGVPVLVVDNEADGQEQLEQQVERVFRHLVEDWDGA